MGFCTPESLSYAFSSKCFRLYEAFLIMPFHDPVKASQVLHYLYVRKALLTQKLRHALSLIPADFQEKAAACAQMLRRFFGNLPVKIQPVLVASSAI